MKLTVAWAFPPSPSRWSAHLAPSPGSRHSRSPMAAPVPTEFVAVTVKVYDVPLVRPVTVIGLALPVAVLPPGFRSRGVGRHRAATV